MLAQLNLIESCAIFQVDDDEWEISLYGADSIDLDDCVVHFLDSMLMKDDFSENQWFYSVENAIEHLIKLGIAPQIRLYPLWPGKTG